MAATHLFQAHAAAGTTGARPAHDLAVALLDAGAALHVAVGPLAPRRYRTVQVGVAGDLVARLRLVQETLARPAPAQRLLRHLPRAEALAAAAAGAAVAPGRPGLEGAVQRLGLGAVTGLLDGTLTRQPLALGRCQRPGAVGLQAVRALAAGPVGPLADHAVDVLHIYRTVAAAASGSHAHRPRTGLAADARLRQEVALALVLAAAARPGALRPLAPEAEDAVGALPLLLLLLAGLRLLQVSRAGLAKGPRHRQDPAAPHLLAPAVLAHGPLRPGRHLAVAIPLAVARAGFRGLEQAFAVLTAFIGLLLNAAVAPAYAIAGSFGPL
mmetsp:Transcript_77846/g.228206  ORF Transcript_77846/g.228206 Transcript_77846/m.228206 type:complete len:326 (+) Transcript_77846:1304-2281(+)